MKRSLSMFIILIAGVFTVFSCALSNKKNIDPSALSRTNSMNSGYIYGTYIYEMKSPYLMSGSELGFLTLLVVPAEDTGEKEFMIKFENNSGFFIYTLNPGKYMIKELTLQTMNSPLTVRHIDNFPFEIKSGEISYLGKYSLYLFCDGNFNITISARSVSNESENDRAELIKKNPLAGDFNFTVSTNSINIPRQVYFQLCN